LPFCVFHPRLALAILKIWTAKEHEMKRAILAVLAASCLMSPAFVFMTSAAGAERRDAPVLLATQEYPVACGREEEARDALGPRLRWAICIERAPPSAPSAFPAGYRLRRG
jgi:hypothetical protein